MAQGEAERVWLISGCSTGIGRAIAEAALAHGDRVAATARRPESIADLVEASPDRARALTLDVTDRAAIEEAVRACEASLGPIDVLVNNAGYGYMSALEEGEGRLPLPPAAATLNRLYY